MAQPSFSARVADRVVDRMGQQADAIVSANPIPPGYQQVESFDDFLQQWKAMPSEKRKQLWSTLDENTRKRLIDVLGIDQIMLDIGSMSMPSPTPGAAMQQPGQAMPPALPGMQRAGPMPGQMPQTAQMPPAMPGTRAAPGRMPMPRPMSPGMGPGMPGGIR